MPTERAIRDALRRRVLAATAGAKDTVDEFWVPRSNERADLAVIGQSMDGFEIKTERDTLRRLPRQAAAYGRLFDRCAVVVAEKHLDHADAMLPEWWGITTVHMNGSLTFTEMREARPNPDIEPETLVRLLWRDEAMTVLLKHGGEPDQRASRNSMWAELLRTLTLTQLRATVRRAILSRDPAQARIATRRFMPPPASAEAGR